MKSLKIFLFFLFIRILSVFVVKTWYVPDEYWQSLEVGHKLAFGFVFFCYVQFDILNFQIRFDKSGI